MAGGLSNPLSLPRFFPGVGLGIERNEEIPSSEAIAKRLQALVRAMEKLEPVNMRAIDERGYSRIRENPRDPCHP